MASITLHDVDDGLERRLRLRATANGRSPEQEAREILCAALADAPDPPDDREDLGTAIRKRFAPLHAKYGDIELELPPRQYVSDESPFDDWSEEDWKALESRGSVRNRRASTEPER